MAKRANGEGNIDKRPNGSWRGRLACIDDLGRLSPHAMYGKTKGEVRAKLAEVQTRLEAGVPVKDAQMSLEAWLTEWAATSLKASDRKQVTQDLYASMVRVHLVPALGHLRLDRLKPSDVEGLIAAKRAQGLAGSTVRTIYTVLRAALDVAVRDGLVQRTVAAVIRRPLADSKEAGLPDRQAGLRAVAGPWRASAWRRWFASSSAPGCGEATCWRSRGTTSTSMPRRCALAAPLAGPRPA